MVILMKIRTSYLPIRLVIEHKQPVTLNVEVKNTEETTRNYTVVVSLPSKLGFDKAGLTKEHRERIYDLEPGEWGSAKFKIWPKFGLKPGVYDIEIYIREHPQGRFDKDIAIARTSAPLRVISAKE